MAALAILRRDLVRFARNPVRTALLFSVPIVFAGIFALVFGGGGVGDITVTVLVHDEDEGLVSMFLNGVASQSGDGGRLDLVPVGPEGAEMMERGEASALVHIPEGFTEDLVDGVPATLGLVKNPSQAFLPLVVEEGLGLGAEVLSEASHVFRPELDQISAMRTDPAFPSDAAIAALSTGVNAHMRGLDRWLFPPVITLETSTVQPTADEERPEPSMIALFLPGLAVMGVLFLAQAATRDILRDRETGLLRHLLTAPVTATDYLLGKTLSVLVVTVLGFGILVAVGLIVGASWGPATTAVALVVATAVGASGTLVLLMSLAGTERQADAISTIVIMVWSLLGGAFVPLSQMPSFLEAVARSTLVYWAVSGFNQAAFNGVGVGGVALNILVLGGCGVLFLLLGAGLLRRRMVRGVL